MIVNDFEQLSSFSAGIERLSTFLTSMRDADPARSNEDSLLALPAEVNATNIDEEPMKSEAETEMSNQSIQLNLQKMPSRCAGLIRRKKSFPRRIPRRKLHKGKLPPKEAS